MRYSDSLKLVMNKHPRPLQPCSRIAPKISAARKKGVGSARHLELKAGANGMLAYVATTPLSTGFGCARSSPGRPPKAQKVGAQRRVITAMKRPAPAISQESRDLHRRIAEAGDQLSLANVSQSLLARYGAK